MAHIRLAKTSDIESVANLSNWAALNTVANFATEPEPLEDWLADFEATHERFPWLIAEVDDAFAGFAKASPWKGRCAYMWSAETTVYVDPTMHRRGVGLALYRRLVEITKAQGFASLIGGISLPNDASVGLHERCGFRHAGTFEKVGFKFGSWHDVGYWQLVFDLPEAPNALASVVSVAGGES